MSTDDLIISFWTTAALFAIGFWLMMLVDVRRIESKQERFNWILVIFLTGLLGAVLYYSTERPKHLINTEDQSDTETQ